MPYWINNVYLICGGCKLYKRHYAKGFCRSCYRRDTTKRINTFFQEPKKEITQQPRRRLVTCWRCEVWKPHFALSLCWGCYSYFWDYVDRSEHTKEYNRKERKRYHERRKEKQKIYKKLRYEQNKERVKAEIKKYREKNPTRVKQTRLKYTHRIKKEYQEMLGGECICDGFECWHVGYCGIKHPWVLQTEHINGDGAFDKKRFSDRAEMRRYYLNHPEEAKQKLRLFCANCNWFKVYKKKEFNQHARPFLLPIASHSVSCSQK